MRAGGSDGGVVTARGSPREADPERIAHTITTRATAPRTTTVGIHRERIARERPL
jgi:hypothetical protein